MAIPDGGSYSTLRVEFETNTLYAPAYAEGSYGTVASLANTIASPQYLMDVTTVDARAVQSVVVKAEWDALTQPERDNWRDLMSTSLQGGFVVRDQGYRDQVQAIWSGTATLTAFAALQQREATEFEAFWDNLALVFEALSCTVDDVVLANAAP
jgi:hypothetical protein